MMLCVLPGSHPDTAALAQGQQQASIALGGALYLDTASSCGSQAHFDLSWLASAPGLLHPPPWAQLGLGAKRWLHGATHAIPRNVWDRWSNSPWRDQSPYVDQPPNP